MAASEEDWARAMREIRTDRDFRRLYEQQWPPATMTSEQVYANRRCPYGGGRHDCECMGECPWSHEKERKARAHDNLRRHRWRML